jgi:hypothetical protein
VLMRQKDNDLARLGEELETVRFLLLVNLFHLCTNNIVPCKPGKVFTY